MDKRENLVNYYFQQNQEVEGRDQALKAYRLSKTEYYRYGFYDRFIRNKLFLEGYIGSNQIYDRKGLSVQSLHNYSDSKWVYVSLLHETRSYDGPTFDSNYITLGHIARLTPDTYIQSALSFSPERSFFPTFNLDNEVYYTVSPNTYSLLLRLSHYERENLATLSPSVRHDFASNYIGARAYFVVASDDLLPSLRLFAGHSFSYKMWGEVGVAGGESREDGFLSANFTSLDLQLRRKIDTSKEIGIKYILYNSNILHNDNTIYLNLLWKY